MKIYYIILFIIVSCTQRQASGLVTLIEDLNINLGTFLTDTVVTKEIILKDVVVDRKHQPIVNMKCPIRLALNVACRIKELSTDKCTYEISFPFVCFVKNDTCFMFHSSKLRRSQINEYETFWRNTRTTKNHVFVNNEEKYKQLIDKNTINKIILIFSETFNRRLYYAIKNGFKDISDNLPLTVGLNYRYIQPFLPVPLEIENVIVSNEEY